MPHGVKELCSRETSVCSESAEHMTETQIGSDTQGLGKQLLNLVLVESLVNGNTSV